MSEGMSAEENHTTGRFITADRTAIGVGCAALLAGILILSLAHGTPWLP
jgi:hypothetical protein